MDDDSIKNVNRSRRQFGLQLAKTGAFLAASFGTGPFARMAKAAVANPDPRFLINIHNRGGADAMWSQAYFAPTDLISAGHPATTNPATNYGGMYTDRFPSSMAVQHPTNSNYLLGLAMSIFNASDFAQMAIWRGIQPDGSHDIGNRIINCGAFSNYAAGFSPLISIALAATSVPLPLHYAEADASQAALYTWPGMLTGYAIPVNLPWNSPTSNTFADFTSALPHEITPAATLAQVDAATQAIEQATLGGTFRLASSKAFIQSFLASFQAMGLVYNSGMGTSPAFTGMVAAYENWAVAALNAFATANSGLLNASTTSGLVYDGMYAGAFQSLNTDIASMGTQLTGSLTMAGIASTNLGLQIAQAAYSFALAEYLITNNLTRVIDIGPMCLNHDGHTDNGAELASMLVKYAMLQALIRRLGSSSTTGTVPGTASHNFLQHTTIVMTTEFDRTPGISIGVPGGYPGTNHGATASVIMAGRGINVGKVFGDMLTSPPGTGKYAAFSSYASSVGAGVGFALPVDMTSGAPSTSGTVMTTKSIFNTVMAAFNVPVSGQQINGGIAFNPILSGE
jgi:hypothetical protein